MKSVICVIVGTVAVALVGASTAFATPQMLSAAKKAGLPASNCQYCHTEAAPKKDTFKPDALNDHGKFLMTDMQKRNLKAPDAAGYEKLKESEKK